MKTLFSVLFIVSIATVTFAQTIASTSIVASQITERHTTVLSETKIQRIAQEQNTLVINQLQSYLGERLEYSDLMARNNIEGEVIVQINISKFGIIVKNRIIKSPNQIASDEVLKVMEGFTRVAIEESIYYGNQKIRIPISFSIR